MPTQAATGFSTQSDTAFAVDESLRMATKALKKKVPTLGIVFASPRHDLGAALTAAQRALPAATFVGCTTAGEITEQGLTRGGLAVMLLSSADMLVDLRTASGVKANPKQAASELARGFSDTATRAAAKGLSASSTMPPISNVPGPTLCWNAIRP